VPGEESGPPYLNRGLCKTAVADARERAHDGDSDVRLFRGLHLFDGVALDHVTDLVAESSGQLVQLFRALDQPSIDVDISAGQCKGVDLLRVHDVEMPIQVRAAGSLRDRVAKSLDVSTDGRIGYDRDLGVDFLGVLPAESDFLVLRDRAGRN
jgi:hypothetical protein